jgi:hypothetical protein
VIVIPNRCIVWKMVFIIPDKRYAIQCLPNQP